MISCKYEESILIEDIMRKEKYYLIYNLHQYDLCDYALSPLSVNSTDGDVHSALSSVEEGGSPVLFVDRTGPFVPELSGPTFSSFFVSDKMIDKIERSIYKDLFFYHKCTYRNVYQFPLDEFASADQFNSVINRMMQKASSYYLDSVGLLFSDRLPLMDDEKVSGLESTWFFYVKEELPFLPESIIDGSHPVLKVFYYDDIDIDRLPDVFRSKVDRTLIFVSSSVKAYFQEHQIGENFIGFQEVSFAPYSKK